MTAGRRLPDRRWRATAIGWVALLLLCSALASAQEQSCDFSKFVFETGIKFRVNINETLVKLLHHFTDYRGLRLGIKNRGAFSISALSYVLEFGAGSF